MKFNTPEELIEYVNIIGADRLRTFDITFTALDASEYVPTVEVPVSMKTLEEGAVGIATLSDTPVIKAALDESLTENVLHVEAYDSIPLSCSTGKVTVLGRSIYLNVCEAVEDNPVVHLNVTLNEKTYYNVPFTLKKTQDSDSDYIMLLNPKTLPNE